MIGTKILVTAALMALATASTRFLPFVAGRRLASLPVARRLFVERFPPAVLAVLTVFIFFDTASASPAVQFAQATGAVATTLLHLAFRNLLLSVGAGTGLCVLVRTFAPI